MGRLYISADLLSYLVYGCLRIGYDACPRRAQGNRRLGSQLTKQTLDCLLFVETNLVVCVSVFTQRLLILVGRSQYTHLVYML